MSTTQLAAFGVTLCILLFVLGWRFVQAEEGNGFLPVSRDVAGDLLSAFLGFAALVCFAASAVYLAQALSILFGRR